MKRNERQFRSRKTRKKALRLRQFDSDRPRLSGGLDRIPAWPGAPFSASPSLALAAAVSLMRFGRRNV